MDWIIILAIWIALVATSYWEAAVEGRNSWDKGKRCWKIKTKHYVLLTGYHFALFWIMFPALLFIPYYMSGFSGAMLQTLAFGYISGLIIEDFFWFIFNKEFKFKDWNPKKVTWYPWMWIGNFSLPIGYVVGFLLCLIILIL